MSAQNMSPENLAFLEDLYRESPTFWEQAFTDQIIPTAPPPTPSISGAADLRIYRLINAYRTYGHLLAKVDPILPEPAASSELPGQLKLENLGFSSAELSASFPACGLLAVEHASLHEIIDTLQAIYCNKIGIEYMFIEDPALKHWLQEQIESTRFQSKLSIEQKQMILQHLNRSELFESFIHTKYTGQKRFSLEGAETLIPMLEVIIETGSRLGSEQFVIGMAHRGRLNVLTNILKKSYREVFSEFEEGYIPNSFEGSGDVKYHKGFSSEVVLPNGKKVKIYLPPNPSHLESINPVVEGLVKARQVQLKDAEQSRVIPILIHGDAAISGQGIVYETLEMSQLEGYATGGTIHLVINNQIGFTALPSETRSTRYCTDIAKAFHAPVFHVNAEDPEACISITHLATEIRQKFHCDVFIDLICYRKYGHNESDEPAYTQPLEYQVIRRKRPIREIYRDQLIQEGIVEKHLAEALEKEFTQELQKALQENKDATQPAVPTEKKSDQNASNRFQTVDTAVSQQELIQIAQKISTVPADFTIHPKLHQLVIERLKMVSETSSGKLFDWGMAELLAYGSLLWQGVSVRLSGQDCKRGTFSHRHAVWVDQKIEQAYVPLQHLKPEQGRFDVLNSHLSEYGVLGFEFGYSCAYPGTLVLWEAQFGDFSNGAQIIIDQYIATAEQKWGQKVGLVLLLPHGYEGQGPEHSSARMERFLTLCGNDNMRLANPTTPAQFFHLLRRQMLHPVLKPLVIFTPKGLLRHPLCTSHLEEFTQGSFQEILDDPAYQEIGSTQVKRLVLCSGRIYYDLIAEREKRDSKEMAIIRIEQLYPLDLQRLKQLVQRYPAIQDCTWVQEEPDNMGAWIFIKNSLKESLPTSIALTYVGRRRSASPATGSHAVHKKQHADLLNALFGR